MNLPPEQLIKRLDRSSEPIRRHYPWRSYYYVNWRDGKPKSPESYPNRERIPERVAPLGFILAFGLQGDTPFTKQAEIDYLIETQHSPRCTNRKSAWTDCCTPSDIAPEWQEMRENGLPAFSIDQLRDQQTDEGETVGDITYEEASRTPLDLPSRAEQALNEWEKSSWNAGPVVRFHWDITDKGTVQLILDSIKHQAGPYITHLFTPEEKRTIIMAKIDQHARDGTIPTAEEILQRQHDYDQRQRTGVPIPRATKPHPSSEWELEDPYRYQLHGSDPETHNRRQDGDWDSPWLLGYEDTDDDMRNFDTTIATGELDRFEVGLREAPDSLEAGYRPLDPTDFPKAYRKPPGS